MTKKINPTPPMFDIPVAIKRELPDGVLKWLAPITVISALVSMLGVLLIKNNVVISEPILREIMMFIFRLTTGIFLLMVMIGIVKRLFMSSYIVTGKIRMGGEYIVLPDRRKIRYEGISLIVDYITHEQLVADGPFRNEAKRISGSDNTFQINFADNEIITYYFACKKERDIKRIREVLSYLKKEKGVGITYREKGQEIPL